MIRILFVCHGNICRSPMAENVFRERALAAGLQVLSDSAAVSAEELGSGMYPAAREKLRREGVRIYGMDKSNLRGMMRILGGDPAGKVGLLLECAGLARDIADPWYTGDFDRAYADIVAGCDGLIQMLKEGKRK